MNISRNSLANLIGALAPLLISIITVPLYISAIGEERYGVLAVIWTILTYFYFFDVGLGRATSQGIARLGADPSHEASNILWTSIWMTLASGTAGGLLLWFTADVLLNNFFTLSGSARTEALESLPWLVFFMPLLIINSALGGALQARERFIEMNVVNILTIAINQVFPLLMALTGRIEMKYLIPFSLLGNCLMTVLYFVLASKYVPIRAPGNIKRNHVQSLLTYGGKMTMVSVIAPLLVTIDRLFIGAMIGGKAVSYYVISYNLTSRMLVISGSMASATFPRLASLQTRAAHELSLLATKRLAAVMTPVALAGILGIYPFLTLWLGKEFATSAKGIGEILLFGTWINCYATAHYTSLQAAGRLNVLLALYLVEIPIYLLVLWFSISNWGVIGAAVAWSIRTSLDAVALLCISGVFLETTGIIILPLCLIASSQLIAFNFDYLHPTYWLSIILLVAIAIWIGRKELLQIAASILPDKKRAV